MATSKEYLSYILEQLGEIGNISHRAMMGEYVLYYKDKVIGGIYDNRFLVKPVKSAVALLPDAPMETPYEGAKDMLMIEDVENHALMAELMEAMYDELPAPKPKKKRK
ncbi:MAG: TfoX/Sxy family protein [Ruminococcus sp.]|nr:TfoX/Sxy family protein [uncultured Ruminococcus sp.]MBQ1350575.1 TfoX/Sxy family protein [Ruminococcus sp.]MBQ4170884.1 TfoX/Sxy family protein [Ruminococcus sp.]MBQ4260493.1 TfoX/Sxy family protein [Ruminococcus sp.]SCX27887.1 TfoX N-terminal domain-containing protein [Ruminococcaceae bacterium P7]